MFSKRISKRISKRFSIRNFPLENKTVFVRVDYNAPLEKAGDKLKVSDNARIRASLQTIRYLLNKNCKIVLGAHLGRPKGKVVEELRLDPVAKELQKLLPQVKVIKLDDCIGREVKEKISNKKISNSKKISKETNKETSKGTNKGKPIFLLENLRFYKEEENNDRIFAHSLADLVDVYINDAFGVAHRKHASVSAITEFLPSMAGFLLENELAQLRKALKPRRPSVWILGGAKLNKIDLIKQALKKADYILVGGALAFSFLKAKDISVGMSKVDRNSVLMAKKILKKRNAKKKIILPLDFVAASDFSLKAKTEVVDYNRIGDKQIALDLGPKSTELFKRYLRKAHTIIWNGPLGYFEWEKFSRSTKEIGRFLGTLTATSICGGGETAEALRKFHLQHNITHLSTGGGAALEVLSGNKLPALLSLEKNRQTFLNKANSLKNSGVIAGIC